MKILVVEDEETNMAIISIALRHRGHDVLCAYCPEVGLTMAVAEQPDVILMDLMFKGATIDGIECIRRLKADPATRHLPVIAQTASVLEYSVLAVRGAGADGFIRKPFRRQELLDAIQQALDKGARAFPPTASRTVAQRPAERPLSSR